MATLSSESYKGARDWYPEDMRVRNYIFNIWKKVVTAYGYEQYDAPLLEPIEVYAAKSGQELVNEQTYQFIDRGERRVAIRPEMTPSVSRMIAARRQEIAYPARWYSIAQFMRYERPQRGREREFWQLNADIFGVDSVAAEGEIIAIGDDILKAFGATESMYTIRVNNRNVINIMMSEYLELDAIQSHLMMKLFDRKNKISAEDFRDQAMEIFGEEHAKAGIKKMVPLLAARSMHDLPSSIRDSAAVKDVHELFASLKKIGIKNAIFDITLMRGLDYYTGTVFEFFDNDPENKRSLFGGGRYDGLVGLFGAEPVTAVGFAPGLTTTELFLRSHDLLPARETDTDIYMVVVGDTQSEAAGVAKQLRDEGVNVEVDISGRKVDKQLKAAVKKGVQHIMFVGEEDVKAELYPVRNTATKEEQRLSLERIVTGVRDRRVKQTSDDDFDIPS